MTSHKYNRGRNDGNNIRTKTLSEWERIWSSPDVFSVYFKSIKIILAVDVKVVQAAAWRHFNGLDEASECFSIGLVMITVSACHNSLPSTCFNSLRCVLVLLPLFLLMKLCHNKRQKLRLNWPWTRSSAAFSFLIFMFSMIWSQTSILLWMSTSSCLLLILHLKSNLNRRTWESSAVINSKCES